MKLFLVSALFSTINYLSGFTYAGSSQNEFSKTPKQHSAELAYDVAIIGAGMSGLSAARHLIENGVKDIVVFEASERVGGRIHTVHFKNGYLELGAQWIHGATLLNNIYNLANMNKLIKNESCLSHEGDLILEDGEQMPHELLEKVYKDIETIGRPIDVRTSYEAHFNEHFLKILSKYSKDELYMVKQMLNTYKVQRMFFEGDELSLISSKDKFLRFGCDVDINAGNYKLIEAVMDVIDKKRIFLNHEVKTIDWNANGGELTVVNNDVAKKVKVNFIICTVSIGVLKHDHQTMFTPKLPVTKVKSIKNIHFGKGVKIFLYYERPFWRVNHDVYFTLGLNDKNYKNADNNWLNRIVEFYALPDNPNVLLTVAYGNVAEKVELLPNYVIAKGITEKLRTFTGDQTLPFPAKVIKSSWITNRFFRGVYSSPSLTGDGNESNDLSLPLPSDKEPRLLFAGEATVERHYGTMHAARESGVREATRIINFKSR